MDAKQDKKYPLSETTQKIIGCAFEVYNQLGYGLPERAYQAALAVCFEEHSLRYSREKYSIIKFGGKTIGKFYLDFLVEDKIAVELKVRIEQRQSDVSQLLNYLRSEKLNIGLLLIMTPKEVKIKRLIN